MDVIDGNLVRVRIGGSSRPSHRVRLIGVEAPSLEADTCGAAEATSFAYSRAFRSPIDSDRDGLFDRGRKPGVKVELRTDRALPLEDSAGALLAYVRVESGQLNSQPAAFDLNRALIFAGLAETAVYRRTFEREDDYSEAEDDAQLEERGLWTIC